MDTKAAANEIRQALEAFAKIRRSLQSAVVEDHLETALAHLDEPLPPLNFGRTLINQNFSTTDRFGRRAE